MAAENYDDRKSKPLGSLFKLGLMCSICACLLVFTAFASPFWYQSWSRVHSPVSHVGLWHICLSGWVKPNDPNMDSYVGCWWIHSTYFYDVWDLLMPPWFRAVQALVIFTLLCNIVAMVLLILYSMDGTRRAVFSTRRVKMLFIISALLAVAGFFVFLVALVFAMMSLDKAWMPRPWMHFLSWSYGFNTLSGFFSAFGAISIFVLAMILREKPFEPGRAVSKEIAGSHGSLQTSEKPPISTGSASTTSKVGESFV